MRGRERRVLGVGWLGATASRSRRFAEGIGGTRQEAR